MAQIELHLTFGCEVALDVTHAHVSKLEDVQNEYLRRLLGLNRRSVLATLFSETGIIPLCYRRLSLAIGYLAHLMSLPPSQWAISPASLTETPSRSRGTAKTSDTTTVTKKGCPSATILIAACTDFTLKTKITAEKNTVSLHKTLLTHTRLGDLGITRRIDPRQPRALPAPSPLRRVYTSPQITSATESVPMSAALLSMPAVTPQFFTQPVLEPVVVLTRTATLVAALSCTFESDLDLDDNHQ
ncbi:hypothetical protein B0H14DRAFT_3738592 [Mycena olivaceomarginata]|nr:hypothetical protein B0H14DRAFT_3738592 [Mycena olivaceomarginata]